MHLCARLERQGDLRVKVCSPLGGHKQGDTGVALKSGRGISRSSSRGETDDFGPIQAPYVPQEVGRITTWLLPWVVVN